MKYNVHLHQSLFCSMNINDDDGGYALCVRIIKYFQKIGDILLNELNLFTEGNFLIRMFLISGVFSCYQKENKTIFKHCFDFFSKTFFKLFCPYCLHAMVFWIPKLFWPTVRKKCSGDQEKRLKFQAGGWEFAKILR